MSPAEISAGVELLEQAVASLLTATSVRCSLKVDAADLDRLRRLRQLVMEWRGTGVVPLDLILLTEDCLSRFVAGLTS
jgi:hypothetical protein